MNPSHRIRRVRPNPWIYTIVAAAAVLVVGWALWPDGQPAPGPAATPAATVVTPVTAATDSPAASPSPTTTAPAPPPGPVRGATELGDMTWSLVSPTGDAAARWVTNPVWTGTDFVYLAGADRLTLNRSADGLRWDSSATDFDASEAEQLNLVRTSDGFLMTAVGFGRPRAWRSPDGNRWAEVDLPRPAPPAAGPIRIYWDWDLHSSARPGGGSVLWTGAWFGIDWNAVLGDEGRFAFELDPESGNLLVRRSATDPGSEYAVSVEAGDGSVHVVVRDVATDTDVHDSVSITGGFDAELVAAALSSNLGADVWRPLGWLIPGSGDPVLLQPRLGGVPAGSSWFTATDDGLISGTSTSANLPQADTLVARSDDGRTWDLLPTDVFPQAWVAGATSDGDVAVIVGSMWQTVQLADQVTARTQLGVALRSDNLIDWEVHEAGFPAGPFDLAGIGSGPLGFAAVSYACPAGCSYQAWLSADGRSWSRLSLPRPASTAFAVSGLAVSTDRIVMIGAAEDGFGILSDVTAWVGSVDR